MGRAAMKVLAGTMGQVGSKVPNSKLSLGWRTTVTLVMFAGPLALATVENVHLGSGMPSPSLNTVSMVSASAAGQQNAVTQKVRQVHYQRAVRWILTPGVTSMTEDQRTKMHDLLRDLAVARTRATVDGSQPDVDRFLGLRAHVVERIEALRVQGHATAAYNTVLTDMSADLSVPNSPATNGWADDSFHHGFSLAELEKSAQEARAEVDVIDSPRRGW